MNNSRIVHILPEVVIKRNRFLEPIFTAYIRSHAQWKMWLPPTKEEIERRAGAYREEWKKYEKEILEGVCRALGASFKQNIIYVHIVGGNPRSFSNPIVIKSGFSPEEFVIVLTHELVHNLLREGGIPGTIYKKLYPDETHTAGLHVVVYAVLHYVYLEILSKENCLESYIAQAYKARDKGYARSVEIVKRRGYAKILERFKKATNLKPVALA